MRFQLKTILCREPVLVFCNFFVGFVLILLFAFENYFYFSSASKDNSQTGPSLVRGPLQTLLSALISRHCKTSISPVFPQALPSPSLILPVPRFAVFLSSHPASAATGPSQSPCSPRQAQMWQALAAGVAVTLDELIVTSAHLYPSRSADAILGWGLSVSVKFRQKM